MKQTTAEIISNDGVAAGYFRIVFRAPEIAAIAEPGQFVHIRIPGIEPTALRRPISICDVDGENVVLLYKTVGRGTMSLSKEKPGVMADILGPLGNCFRTGGTGVPLLVGGGFGVAPLLFLARRMGDRKGVLFTGGRTAGDVLLADEFAELGWKTCLATNDGTLGIKGFVTDAMDAWRKENPDVKCEMFACGPDGMLRAVGDRASAWDCKAWLSLDKRMVCGVGACLACVQNLRRKDGSIMTVRVCKEGPVFESRAIVWGQP